MAAHVIERIYPLHIDVTSMMRPRAVAIVSASAKRLMEGNTLCISAGAGHCPA